MNRRHKDTGLRCLVAHEGNHGQCIRCTCGDWVPPDYWIEHIGQDGADYGINISSAGAPDIMGDYPKKKGK